MFTQPAIIRVDSRLTNNNSSVQSSCSAGEHRAATILLQRTRFSDALFSSAHVIPAALTSASVLLLQVCLGRPTFLFPWGFHSRDCLVTFADGLRNVWPIHPHFLFLISCSMEDCFILSQRSLLEITPGHLMLRMLRRHLLTNVCILSAKSNLPVLYFVCFAKFLCHYFF